MKLTSVHLQNYRAHQDLRVEFNLFGSDFPPLAAQAF